MTINYGRDQSGRPPRSRPKIEIGIFFSSRCIEIIEIGDPGSPRLVGMNNFFSEIHRDNTRQVGESREYGGYRDYLEIPRFPRLSPTFFLVLRCPRKIPTFCSIFEVIRGPKIPTYLDISTYPDIYNLPFRLNWTTSTNDLFPRIFPKYPDFPRNILTYPDLTEQWNLRKLYFWK